MYLCLFGSLVSKQQMQLIQLRVQQHFLFTFVFITFFLLAPIVVIKLPRPLPPKTRWPQPCMPRPLQPITLTSARMPRPQSHCWHLPIFPAPSPWVTLVPALYAPPPPPSQWPLPVCPALSPWVTPPPLTPSSLFGTCSCSPRTARCPSPGKGPPSPPGARARPARPPAGRTRGSPSG